MLPGEVEAESISTFKSKPLQNVSSQISPPQTSDRLNPFLLDGNRKNGSDVVELTKYQTEPETDITHRAGYPAQEDQTNPQTDNQLMHTEILASEDLKKLGITSIEDNTNPGMAEGARSHDNNSSNNGSNDSSNDDNRNHDYTADTSLPSPERKRSRIHSSRTSKAKHSTKKRRLLPVHQELSINGNLISDTKGNSARRESNRKIGRPRLSITNRPHKYNNRFSSKQRRMRSRSSAEEDGEYEVEEVLDARLYRGNLEYRAKWVGYPDDHNWYLASGFEKSAYRVRDFHANNPTHPGPPQSLDLWIQRCDKGSDTE